MDRLRPELDTVLQSLSLNGFSIFSLVDYILASYNREDQRIKPLREEMERDIADICIRLLSHNPAGLKRVLDFGKAQFKNHRHAVTIDILPDNVFLEIFDFCLCQYEPQLGSKKRTQRTKKWQILVHVCRRWRSLIFASPRRLNLYLSCSYGTRVRENLAYWPVTLPLSVDYGHYHHTPEDDNVLAALEHSGRVHRISIVGTDSLLKKVGKVMQKQFPALSHLYIEWNHEGNVPVIPRTFLGRPALQLQYLYLSFISLPHLPLLLSSASNLVTLTFENISQAGYTSISPKVMAEGLAMLPNLTTLSIIFSQGSTVTDQSPPIQAILPSLTSFNYRGYSDYLEDLLARLDTPRVHCVEIDFYVHDHRALQLSRFLNRTENLKLDQFMRARLILSPEDFSFKLDYPPGNCCQAVLSLTIYQDWGVMPVPYSAHILGQLTATFSNVDHLSVHGDQAGLDEINSTEWLPFLRQFPAVEELHLSGGVEAYIVSELEHTADSVTDLLPALHSIWLDDRQKDDDDVSVGSMERFLSLRQLSGRPVTIVDT